MEENPASNEQAPPAPAPPVRGIVERSPMGGLTDSYGKRYFRHPKTGALRVIAAAVASGL